MEYVYSIICDDIRFEQNNKISLIGVYSDNVIVPQLPFTFPKFCLAQEFDDADITKQIRFALKGPKINLPEIIGRITSDRTHETKRVKIPLCIGPITFEQEGEYSFETYVDDKELPIYIKKFRISLKPAPH